jgi:multiple sugar transport system substrate-binding protein
MDKLVSSGVKQPFWMPNRWPAHLIFLSLIWQHGGEPYAEDGASATFNSEAGVQALTWMTDVVKKGWSPKNVAQDSQYTAFKNGQGAVTWDGIWQINDVKATKLKWGVAPIPQIGSTNAVWANSHNFTMVKGSGDANKQEASRVFIGWMSAKSKDWAGAGMIPARNSERTASEGDNPQVEISKQVDAMRFLPAVPELGTVQAQTLEVAVRRLCWARRHPSRRWTTPPARPPS